MDKCFVIMPIGKDAEYKKWRGIFEDVFKQSVEASGLDLKCERADDIHKSGSIMKQVLEQLNSARIVLADLTSQNPNVFYELGVRQALDKRSILVGQSPHESPFDTSQYRMLVYKYPVDLSDDFHLNIGQFLIEVLSNPDKPDNPVSDLFPKSEVAAYQSAIRALTFELEDDVKIAERFQTGLAFIAPLNAEWLARRANLQGLPENVQAELTAAYGKINRWKAEVDAGIHPLIGSMEIPKICQELKSELPPLIAKLKQLF
jgi:hypothetical protein